MLYEWPNKAIAIKSIHMKFSKSSTAIALLSFIMLFPGKSYSQFCIGFTPNEVIDQALNNKAVRISKRYVDNTLCISWANDNARALTAVFFKGDLSTSSSIEPYDRESLSQWLIVLNRNYAKEGPDEWTAYFRNITLTIVLKYFPSSDDYSFLIFKKAEPIR